MSRRASRHRQVLQEIAIATATDSVSPENAKVGFIGLGQMGAPMVTALLKAGRQVTVFDINPQAVAGVTSRGAKAASSLAALAAQSDLVITMLPSSSHVRAVYLSADGIFAHVGKGSMLVDCSTIDPTTARHLCRTAEQQGNCMVDAPVSGSILAAAAASLTFLVGSDRDSFDRLTPLLGPMGKKLIHCGAPGAGQVVKIANNLLAAISMVATSEAMTLGVKLGADPGLLANAINHSTGRCWASEQYNPWPGLCEDAPASHDYVGGASTQILIKDLALALAAASEITHPLFLGALTQQIYQLSAARGKRHHDFSSVIDLYR